MANRTEPNTNIGHICSVRFVSWRTEHAGEPNIASDCSSRFVFARKRTWPLFGSPNVRYGSVRFALVRFGEPTLFTDEVIVG